MREAYTRHRASIDELVKLSTADATATEKTADGSIRRSYVVSGLDGLAVRGDNDLLANIEDGEEIVLRFVADGSIVRRTPAQNNGPGDEVPWTATVVDLAPVQRRSRSGRPVRWLT